MSKLIRGTYWPYIVAGYLCLFSLGMMDNARGPFFPDLIEDLKLSDTQASLFFAIPSLVSFFGSHVTQHLIAKLGTLWALRIGLLCLSGGFALIGAAHSFVSFIIFCAIFGFGLGIVNVAQNVSIQEGARPEQRRRLFSGLHSMYAFASLLAPLVIGGMITAHWSWRLGFVVFAVVGALALLYTVRLKTIPVHTLPPRRFDRHKEERWHFTYVSLLFSAYMVGELLVSSRLVLFVRREHGVSPEQAPMYLALFFAFLLVGRLVFTFLQLRSIKNQTIMVVGMLMSAFTMALGLIYSPWFLSVSALFMAPIFAIAMDFVSEIFQEKSVAAMAYCMSLSALFVVSMHFFAGVVTEWSSLQNALMIGPIAHVIGALLVLGHKRLFKNA